MWIWLTLHDSRLGVPQGWLRAADVERFVAVDAAMRLIDDELTELRTRARNEADACLAEAQARAAQILEDAVGTARERVAVVEADARRQAQADAMAAWHARRLEQTLAQAASVEAQQEALARLVTTAVERVLRSEPARGLFDKALTQVGELLQEAGAATLRVHPEDLEAASEAVADAQGGPMREARIDVVADETLKPGACLFDSAQGSLDASLEVQLEALRAAIAQACLQLSSERAGPGAEALAESDAGDPP
ncbi:FliH/SctL family protein [Xylophilus ampelinus]|uniref:Flagellar assembly protein FliH n=1 Tax=Xylophilus ampelinus TaxID=54067 RepID=A0A318SHK6_9BURK|nr:FliH/SctL family protein [Xylophilus ampelinus]MCS4510413.1 FliH/SctL family protein [Xylophilus ampelinus]PYE77867.1 type III secretion protein L [Xylophilus ampelinus]